MEMMVVLLIVAIIAAASAPMVTKKLSRNTGTGDSPWVFTGLENSIAYNMNESNSSAIIGASTVEDMPAGLERPRLFLNGDNTHPALAFGENGRYVSHIIVDGERNTITFNDAAVGANSTAIGLAQNRGANGLVPQGVTIVGSHAMAHNYATALGYQSGATGPGSLALGHATIASGLESIAIGTYSEEANQDNLTQASGQYSIAIGTMSHANSVNTVAIGHSSEANGNSGIAIGRGALSNNNSGRGIAIGNYATATGFKSIAIGSDQVDNRNGNYTRATEENAVAIGADAQATGRNSVAIGASSRASEPGQIVLGTAGDVVYIPGRLVVDGTVALARNPGSHTYMRANRGSDNMDDRFFDLKHQNDGVLNSNSREYPSNISISSDRRLKNVGEEYTAGLAELKKLDFFHFTFKEDKEKTPHIGVIAQDLEKVFPDAVTKGEDGYLRIRWEDMFYAVINAVKELDNKIIEIVQNITEINSTIEKQNKTIEEQQKTIDELIKRIEKLEKQK